MDTEEFPATGCPSLLLNSDLKLLFWKWKWLLSLANAMGLKLMINEVMLRLARFSTNVAVQPLVSRTFHMNVPYVLSQVAWGAVCPLAVWTHRPLCNTHRHRLVRVGGWPFVWGTFTIPNNYKNARLVGTELSLWNFIGLATVSGLWKLLHLYIKCGILIRSRIDTKGVRYSFRKIDSEEIKINKSTKKAA